MAWVPTDEMVEATATVLRDEHNICGDDRGCQCEDAVSISQNTAVLVLHDVGPVIREQTLRENEALAEARRFAQQMATARRAQGAGGEERAWLDLIHLLDIAERETAR